MSAPPPTPDKGVFCGWFNLPDPSLHPSIPYSASLSYCFSCSIQPLNLTLVFAASWFYFCDIDLLVCLRAYLHLSSALFHHLFSFLFPQHLIWNEIWYIEMWVWVCVYVCVGVCVCVCVCARVLLYVLGAACFKYSVYMAVVCGVTSFGHASSQENQIKSNEYRWTHVT